MTELQTQASKNQLQHIMTLDDFLIKNKRRFTKPQLIWLSRNRKKNGFDSAFIVLSKRIYVNETRFAEAMLAKK